MTAEIVAVIVVLLALAMLVLSAFWLRRRHCPEPVPSPARGAGISLLVPFRSDGDVRLATWKWLREYWEHELPGAQICVGTSFAVPFCKTSAVNQAAAQASGDVFVILDADCYMPGHVIEECAKRIRAARDDGRKLWFIPYRRFYRLTQDASRRLLASNPDSPLQFPDPPPPDDIIPESKKSISHGHWFAALIQIMPREAFAAAGGMDSRFRGWGGEDIAFMRAVDTMYAKHKTADNGTFHVWHPVLAAGEPHLRMWAGQAGPRANDWLSERYASAFGDRALMAQVIASALNARPGSRPAPGAVPSPAAAPQEPGRDEQQWHPGPECGCGECVLRFPCLRGCEGCEAGGGSESP
jgi:Glycosyl transferase family 2/N-terminal domain of galactosyltransferase